MVHALGCSPRNSPRLLPPRPDVPVFEVHGPPRFRVTFVTFATRKGSDSCSSWPVRTLGPFEPFARAFGLASPRGRAQREGHDEPPPRRPSDRSAVPRALVAARLRRLGDARRGSRDDVRGGALGAFGVQLAALAFPLRQARRRELGALPVAAHPLEPELGAHRLGAGLHRLGHAAITDRKTGEPAPSTTHSFDTGAAWVSLALQATRMGYHAHGMSGIQYDLARAELGLPERYQLNAACVIGRIGDPAQLDEKQRAREFPSRPQAAEPSSSMPGTLASGLALDLAKGEHPPFGGGCTYDGRSGRIEGAGDHPAGAPRADPRLGRGDRDRRHRHAERLCLAGRLCRSGRLRHLRRGRDDRPDRQGARDRARRGRADRLPAERLGPGLCRGGRAGLAQLAQVERAQDDARAAGAAGQVARQGRLGL